MVYKAILESLTGDRMVIKLGRRGGIKEACIAAKKACPEGWVVFDVSARI